VEARRKIGERRPEARVVAETTWLASEWVAKRALREIRARAVYMRSKLLDDVWWLDVRARVVKWSARTPVRRDVPRRRTLTDFQTVFLD